LEIEKENFVSLGFTEIVSLDDEMVVLVNVADFETDAELLVETLCWGIVDDAEYDHDSE